MTPHVKIARYRVSLIAIAIYFAFTSTPVMASCIVKACAPPEIRLDNPGFIFYAPGKSFPDGHFDENQTSVQLRDDASYNNLNDIDTYTVMNPAFGVNTSISTNPIFNNQLDELKVRIKQYLIAEKLSPATATDQQVVAATILILRNYLLPNFTYTTHDTSNSEPAVTRVEQDSEPMDEFLFDAVHNYAKGYSVQCHETGDILAFMLSQFGVRARVWHITYGKDGSCIGHGDSDSCKAGHVTTEYYDHKHKKWVFADLLYGISWASNIGYPSDGDAQCDPANADSRPGTPLSLKEFVKIVANNGPSSNAQGYTCSVDRNLPKFDGAPYHVHQIAFWYAGTPNGNGPNGTFDDVFGGGDIATIAWTFQYTK